MIDFIDFALSQIPEDKYKKVPEKKAYFKFVHSTEESRIKHNEQCRIRHIKNQQDPAFREHKRIKAREYRRILLADPIKAAAYREKNRVRSALYAAKMKLDPEYRKYIKKKKQAYHLKAYISLIKKPIEVQNEHHKYILDRSKAQYDKLKQKMLDNPEWAIEYKKKKSEASKIKYRIRIANNPELLEKLRVRSSIATKRRKKIKEDMEKERLSKVTKQN